jgi:hypothetical protein
MQCIKHFLALQTNMEATSEEIFVRIKTCAASRRSSTETQTSTDRSQRVKLQTDDNALLIFAAAMFTQKVKFIRQRAY